MSQEASDTPILSWFQSIPEIGRAFLSFFFEPSTFGRHWMISPSERPSVWVAIGCCLTTCAVLYATNRLIAKKSLLRQLAPEMPEASHGGTERIAHPRIVSITNWASFGIGFALPEADTKGLDVPQRMFLRVAWSYILLDDVVPNSFAAKSTQMLFIIAVGVVTALCSFVPAWAFRTSARFTDVLPLAIVETTFWFSYLAIAFFIAATTLRSFLDKTNTDSGCLTFLIFVAVFAGIPFHSFFESFKAVYAFGNIRMCLSLLGAVILSTFVAPIVFAPVCYVWLRIGALLDKAV